MNNQKIKEFKKILKLDKINLQHYLQDKCTKILKEHQCYNTEGSFLYYKNKNSKKLLVAHLDTVHTLLPTKIYNKNNILSCNEGIGGDDRCGVFIILELIKELDNIDVLFTQDEEVGGIGASDFCKFFTNNNLAENYDYIVEFDRCGNNDAVFYQCANENFINFITENSLFKLAHGSFSDISIIAPYLKKCAVNLSSGYYKAHCKNEYISLKDVDDIIQKSIKLLNTESIEFEYYAHDEHYGYDNLYNWYDDEYMQLYNYIDEAYVLTHENEYKLLNNCIINDYGQIFEIIKSDYFNDFVVEIDENVVDNNLQTITWTIQDENIAYNNMQYFEFDIYQQI